VDTTSLAVWLNIANILDLQTTFEGLKRGLKEANPIANYVLQTSGPQGLATFKIAPILLLSTLAITNPTKHMEKLMHGLTIIFLLASINNIMMITLKEVLKHV